MATQVSEARKDELRAKHNQDVEKEAKKYLFCFSMDISTINLDSALVSLDSPPHSVLEKTLTTNLNLVFIGLNIYIYIYI